jgi:hypothetical protein
MKLNSSTGISIPGSTPEGRGGLVLCWGRDVTKTNGYFMFLLGTFRGSETACVKMCLEGWVVVGWRGRWWESVREWIVIGDAILSKLELLT